MVDDNRLVLGGNQGFFLCSPVEWLQSHGYVLCEHERV